MNLWRKLRQEFAHAFALGLTDAPFSAEERALLQKMARAISQRGMAAPALLFLESLGPLSFLGSQAIHSLKPFLDVVMDPVELEYLAALLERREAVDQLLSFLQEPGRSPA